MPQSKVVKRPINVSINGNDWTVRWLTDSEWSKENHDDGARGLTRYHQREILVLVSHDMVEDVVRDTFMHECHHAVWHTSCLGNTLKTMDLPDDAEDAEEVVILNTSPVMLQMLRNNPDVVEYLLRA